MMQLGQVGKKRVEPGNFRLGKCRLAGWLAILVITLVTLPIAAHAADCIVRPHSTARVGAASKGVISAVHIERGDRVRKGQLLAELESTEEQHQKALAQMRAENDATILLARTRAETAEARVRRLTTLSERKIATQADLDVAMLEAKSARLDEQQAQLNREVAEEEARAAASALERKMVRAPFDGVVVERLLSRGETYNEQEPIVIIARVDPLYVETFLPLSLHGQLAVGNQVPIELETGEQAQGTVIVIDPVLDAATGTFGVRMAVPNPGWTILAGQRCTTQPPTDRP